MGMDAGTLFGVVQFPRYWPPAEDRAILTQDVPSGKMQLLALRTGQLGM